jgi:hypothetical protein
MRITPTRRHHVRAKRRLEFWVKRVIAQPQPEAMTALPLRALRFAMNIVDLRPFSSHRLLLLPERRTFNAAAMAANLLRHLSSPIAKGLDYKVHASITSDSSK